MTTYKNSAGKAMQIAEMNPYHLDNAIKKLATSKAVDTILLAALRAEQAKRGGPPNRGDLPDDVKP